MFGDSFISKTNIKIPGFLSSASLIMEFGQLVPRYDHALHPRFHDNHQVNHAPADIVSAHGQSERCERDEDK